MTKNERKAQLQLIMIYWLLLIIAAVLVFISVTPMVLSLTMGFMGFRDYVNTTTINQTIVNMILMFIAMTLMITANAIKVKNT